MEAVIFNHTTLAALERLPGGVIKIFLRLARMSDEDGIVDLSGGKRKELAAALWVHIGTVFNAVSRLKGAGLIEKTGKDTYRLVGVCAPEKGNPLAGFEVIGMVVREKGEGDGM